MKRFKIILVIVVVIGLLLTGFIDSTTTYTVEELDEIYGTSIANLYFHYRKKHHYSLFNHEKVEYVFRGTKQYSHYFRVTIRIGDKESYLSSDGMSLELRTIPLSIKGYDTKIRILKYAGVGTAAETNVRLQNGFLRVAIATTDNAEIEGYWESNPITDSSYIKIFEDLLLIILD